MPPEAFMDVREIDQAHVAVSREEICRFNPQRHEFQQLDGVFFVDEENELVAGFRDVRDDEFWVRGHIPGRPVFPGVLMIECAAQLVSYYVMSRANFSEFLGFGGVDGVKFRGQVKPGDRFIVLAKMLEFRGRRRAKAATQGFVDGRMVFEGIITGMVV